MSKAPPPPRSRAPASRALKALIQRVYEIGACACHACDPVEGYRTPAGLGAPTFLSAASPLASPSTVYPGALPPEALRAAAKARSKVFTLAARGSLSRQRANFVSPAHASSFALDRQASRFALHGLWLIARTSHVARCCCCCCSTHSSTALLGRSDAARSARDWGGANVPRFVYALPSVCTALCLLCPVCAPPTLLPHIVHLGSLRSRDDSVFSTREQASPLPLRKLVL